MAHPPGAFVVTTTVLDSAALAAAVVDSAAGCIPATCRIGLLGLGNVGSAFARHTREAAGYLHARGFDALQAATDATVAAVPAVGEEFAC